MPYFEVKDIYAARRRQRGFSLLELIVALAILLVVSSIILLVMSRMSLSLGTVANRTDMHSSVRSATELLQQEISQAGRVASPAGLESPANLTQDVIGDALSHSPTASSTTGLFPGEIVMVGPDSTNGAARELLTLTSVSSTAITGVWQDPHSGTATTQKAPIGVQGVFASGIVPPTGSVIMYWSTASNTTKIQTLSATTTAPATVPTPGSSGTTLKMYGDINGDGNMVYIEYTCNLGTKAAPGTLTRRVIPFDTALAKNSTNFPPQVLLSNVIAWPEAPATPTPCFSYQTKLVIGSSVNNDTYVTDVSVTLTVVTQNKDPQSGNYDVETKALLNVSPRNVYEGWAIASLAGGATAARYTTTRIQPMPQSVLNLLNP